MKRFEPGVLNLLITFAFVLFCFFFCFVFFLNSYIFYCSGQGKPLKNAGWDFSISGSQSTGTVRSVVRPPPVRERRPENLYNQAAQRRNLESGNQGLPASGNANHALPAFLSYGKNAREAYHNEHPDNYHEDVIFSLSLVELCLFFLALGSCFIS
jgi:hypothetical protein